MQLVKPSNQYKNSYLKAVAEFQQEGRYQEHSKTDLKKDFDSFVQLLLNQEKGRDLPEGYVAASTYWLIEHGEYIGRVSIRHELTDYLKKVGGHIGYDIRPSKRRQGYGKKILELGLEKARELGMKDILITCDIDNIASKKIIEANGGKFDRKLVVEKNKPEKLHYKIPL